MLPQDRSRRTKIVTGLAVAFCILAYWLFTYRVPIRTGAMYHAVCFTSDWDAAQPTSPKAVRSEYAARVFDVADPNDLFSSFKVKPVLWGKQEIASQAGVFTPDFPAGFSLDGGRDRMHDHPVDGGGPTSLVGRVMDQCPVFGVFEESLLPPKRYMIKGCAHLQLGIPAWSEPPAELRERPRDTSTPEPFWKNFQYSAAASGNLIVFYKQIDDELTELILVDLR